MKYCEYCGTALPDEAKFCTNCGARSENASYTNSGATDSKAAETDERSIGFGILGFFIPIVGLILYLVWKDETPLRAKSAGKGALISVIVNVAFVVLTFLLMLFTAIYAGKHGGMFV